MRKQSENKAGRKAEAAEGGVSRRAFFGGASAAAAGAAAATLLGHEADAQEVGEGDELTRYEETDHVRRFYAVNRY